MSDFRVYTCPHCQKEVTVEAAFNRPTLVCSSCWEEFDPATAKFTVERVQEGTSPPVQLPPAIPSNSAANPNLRKCADCGKEVSVHAEACPHCGATLVRKTKHGVFFYVFWATVSLIGTVIVLMVVSAVVMGFGSAISESAKQEKIRNRTADNVRLSSPPAAASTTPEEKRLIEALPELTWNKSDLIGKGWSKPGQNLQRKSCYFSKANYVLREAVGEIQFLTDDDRVISVAFYVETEREFLTLRRAVEEACNSKGTTGTKGESSTQWTIIGGTRNYCINLVMRKFNDIEMSLEAYVVPLNRECP